MAETQNTQASKFPLRGAGGRIFLVGFMGSGKTHWGRQLGQKMRFPFYDLDEQIEAKEEKPVARIFAESGEEHFRQLEQDVLHMITESHDNFVMATGGGTPCFYNNIGYMKNSGLVVWLDCAVDCMYQRLIKERDKRPLLKGFSEDQLMAYLLKKNMDRKIYYEQAHIHLKEEGINLNQLVDKIFHA